MYPFQQLLVITCSDRWQIFLISLAEAFLLKIFIGKVYILLSKRSLVCS